MRSIMLPCPNFCKVYNRGKRPFQKRLCQRRVCVALRAVGVDRYVLPHLRDLPDILRRHVSGVRALDFGCGTGRSTRLLRSLGYDSFGVDIAQSMVESATRLDPDGTYRLLAEGDLERLAALMGYPADESVMISRLRGSQNPRNLETLLQVCSRPCWPSTRSRFG